MIKAVLRFFDKLEDVIRIWLSGNPILYALIGAVGVILLWKGVSEVAGKFALLDGVGSIILGVVILLSTGLLVSFFVGESIILSGMKGEKKLFEKTESEVHSEQEVLEEITAELRTIREDIEKLNEKKSKKSIFHQQADFVE